MHKFLTATMAAVLATTSLGAAGAASAQSRNDHRYEQRQDHRNYRPNPHQNQRPAPRHDQRDYRQDQRDYARWQQAQRRYNAPRYVAPRGYATRSWSYGQRMPSYYRTSNYVVNDYGRYGLRAPPRGYQYVRSGNDVVLAVVATGLVTAVIAGLFN